MTTEVQPKRFLCKNILNTICCALTLCYVDLNLSGFDAMPDFNELFGEIQRLKVGYLVV
jgi:hypothetical protein